MTESAAAPNRFSLTARRELGIVLALLCLLGAMIVAHFTRGGSAEQLREQFVTLANQLSHLSIAAIGETLVILIGGIDISVGVNLTIAATVSGKVALWAEASGLGGPAGLLLVFGSAIGCGLLFGCVNGFFTGFLRLPGIVVTLGTLSIGRGLLIIWTGGKWVTDLPDWLQAPANPGSALGGVLPIPFLLALAVAVVFGLYLLYAPSGRRLYAVGGNRRAAELAGVHVAWQTFQAYALCGALVGLAAAVCTMRLSSIDANLGTGFELVVIASTVIGGTNIFGGAGGVVGAVAGAAFLVALQKSIFAFGIHSTWEKAFTGGAILVAVALDVWTSRRFRRS